MNATNQFRILLMLSVATICSLANATVRASDTLTIAQCRQMALQHNRQKRIATLAAQEALHTQAATRTLFLPSLTANAALAYSNGNLTASIPGGLLPVGATDAMQGFVPDGSYAWFPGLEMKMKSNTLCHTGVQLTQPLYMGGKIRAAYSIARMVGELQRMAVRKTEAEVIEEADKAYAHLVKATALHQVALRYMALVEELERNVQSAVNHGMKMRTDLLKVQVRKNEVELQLLRTQNAIRLATMNLCHVMGLQLDAPVAVHMSYPDTDSIPPMDGTGVEARPEYGMLDHQTRIAQRQVDIARSEMLPQLALTAGYGYNRGLELNGRLLLHDWSFAGGVGLTVPLYHFGEHTHKVRAAKLRLEQARTEQEDKCSLMMLEVSQCASRLQEAFKEMEVSERSLAQATDNMQVCLRQYMAGTEPLSEYLEAQLLWQKASEAAVDAGFQRYLGTVAYLKATGKLTSE